MRFFGKNREPENETSQNSGSIFEVRREISDLKDLLSAKTKENKKIKAALEDTQKTKMQAVRKSRNQIKHIKRLNKKIERIENEKAELVAENVNLNTKARNSRARAKRYKNMAEKGL